MWRSVAPWFVLGAMAFAAAIVAVALDQLLWPWACAAVIIYFVGAAAYLGLRQFALKVIRADRSVVSGTVVAAVGTAVFVSGTLIFWQVDFRSGHFFDTGWPLVSYNLWRLCLFGFLIAIFRGAGFGLRRWVERLAETSLGQDRLEWFALDMAIGAAAWIILMYAAGALGLYFRPFALAMSAVACAVGLRKTASDVADAVGRWARPRPAADRWTDIATGGLAPALMIMVGCLFVLLALGIIGEDNDTSHYLPYYEQVVRNHGIGPNDYWYHFWITKGAGLHFLAVMLGDMHAPALVSFAFLLVTGCFVAAFVRRSLPEGRSLAVLAMLAFFGPFLPYFRYQQKLHFVVMALIAGALWTAAWLCDPRRADIRPGLFVLSLLTVAAVLCSVPIAALIGIWLGLFALVAAFGSRGQRRPLPVFLPAVATGCAAALVVVLNYLWVGMGEASPFKLFFDHANQSRLSQYVSPYLVLFIEEASSETTGRITWESIWPPDLRGIWGLLHFGAFPFTMNVLLTVLAVGALTLVFSRVRERIGRPAICVSSLLFSAALASILVSQPGSLNRSYVFAYPLSLILVVLCVVGSIRLVAAYRSEATPAIAAAVATALGIYVSASWAHIFTDKGGLTQLAHHARLIGGRQSIADAIGTLPACAKMSESFVATPSAGSSFADNRPKVWTLNFLLPIGCYLLPRPRILMEVSVSFGPQWHRIVFGSEREALAGLKSLGIQYFYLDLATFDPATSANASSSLMGCMAYSALFNPEAVQRNFRVIWREQDAFLLALSDVDPRGTALPDDFARRWAAKRAMVQPGLGEMKELCERVAGYYRERGENWPVHADRSLPRLHGWQ